MYNVIIFTDLTDIMCSTIQLGPHKCAHVLREAGYSCLVINHLSDYTLNELKEIIDLSVNSETVLVGFSTTFLSTQPIRNKSEPTSPISRLGTDTVFPQGKEFENTIIQYLHQKNPNIKTVAGGHQVNENYSNKNINYVSIGYSEISIVNLVNHLTRGNELNKSYKNIHGCIIIDDRQAKDYNFPNSNMIWTATDVVNHKVLPIEIGRGCIFKCKFCAYPMNGKQQLDFVKNPSILYNELLDNYNNFGITKYIIVDDTLNDHIEKLLSIKNEIQKLPFRPTFWAYIRLDLLCSRPETLQMIYDIGIRSMYFGIETMNVKTGRIIGKGYDRKKQINMIKHIKENYPDIACHGSFIVGLPHESSESVLSTLNSLLNNEIPLDSWQIIDLRIPVKSHLAFSSEFTNNYQLYGYIDQGNSDNNQKPGLVNWKNEYFTSREAASIAEEFTFKSKNSKHFKMAGQLAFHLQTMGYNFNIVKDTLHKDFDWYYCEQIARPTFISNYKKQLLNLIKIRKQNAEFLVK